MQQRRLYIKLTTEIELILTELLKHSVVFEYNVKGCTHCTTKAFDGMCFN